LIDEEELNALLYESSCLSPPKQGGVSAKNNNNKNKNQHNNATKSKSKNNLPDIDLAIDDE
jgi:hypothetical protein